MILNNKTQKKLKNGFPVNVSKIVKSLKKYDF